MYQSFRSSSNYLSKILLKVNVANYEGNSQNEISTPNKDTKLEWLYKVGFEYEFNSWLDSSVG